MGLNVKVMAEIDDRAVFIGDCGESRQFRFCSEDHWFIDDIGIRL